MAVDDNNFLKLFKIHNNHRKILVDTNEEVSNFRDLKLSFDLSIGTSGQAVPENYRQIFPSR